MDISGTYRFESCDNKLGELKALFMNSISEEDLANLASPDNEARVVVTDREGGYEAEVTYSRAPHFNTRFSITFGEESDLPAPFPGTNVSTRKGNVVTEIVKHADVTYTYTTTYSSFGATNRVVSSNDGYIASSFWKRVNAPILGYYVLESHENADKMFEVDSGLSKPVVDEMLSFLAFRVTENNGVYTMTDYMGNGSEKNTVYELGKEFENEDAELGYSGTNLVTAVSPSEILFTYKDKKSGKTAVWRGVAGEKKFVWTVEKPLNGVACKMVYRRCGDIFGTWRTLCSTNYDTLLRGMGMDAKTATDAANEKCTTKVTPKPKGYWEVCTDSKIFKMDPTLYKSGEEQTVVCGEYTFSDVATQTQDGLIGAYKMGDKVVTYTIVVGNQFMTLEEEVDGRPDTRATVIYVRQ